MLRVAVVGADRAHTADQRGHLAGRDAHQLGAVEQQFLGLHDVVLLQPVAEAVSQRFEHVERFGIGLRRRGISATRRKGHADIEARRLGGLLHSQISGQHDHVGHARPGLGGDLFIGRQRLGQTCRLVAFPIPLRGEADARAVGSASFIRAAEGACGIPGGGDHVADAQAGGSDLHLDGSDVVVAAADGRRVLPDEVFLRHVRAEVARLRAHVAVGQLEPGAGEDLLEVGRIVAEALGELAVFGVKAHRHVGVGHDRLAADRGILDVDRHVLFLDADRLPLVSAGGRLLQPPVVAQQQVEVAALAGVPLHRMRGPGALDAAGHGVAADAARRVVHPAEALFLDLRAFGRRAKVGGTAVAVRLADGVTAAGQRDGFLVVHCHAGEGDAHVISSLERVRLAVHALGIHVDQAHHHGGERVL